MHVWLIPLVLAAGSSTGFKGDKLALPGAITQVIPGDVNGDGNQDLLIFWRQGEPPEAKDRISVFLFDGKYKRTADQVLTFPAGSVVFDVGDADQDKHSDVVILKSNGLWILKGGKTGLSESPVQLVRVATVAAFPREAHIPREKLLVELDGGRSGVLLPTVPIGLLSYYEFQNNKGYIYRRSLRVPSEVRIGTAYSSGMGESRGSSYCFNYPSLAVGDTNGDRLSDLIFVTGEKVAVFRGSSDGVFRQDPDFWRSFQQPESEEEMFNRSQGKTADVNGDKLVDLVFSRSRAKGLDDSRVRLSIHLAGKDGNYRVKPDIEVSREGFGSLFLKDLNGDGRDDLVFANVDIGVTDIAGMLLSGSGTLDVEIKCYLSDGRGFSEKADGEMAFSFEVSGKSKSKSPVNPVYGWDFDSDGKFDLATVEAGAGKKDKPDRLVIRRGQGGAEFKGTIWKKDLPAVKSLTAFRLRQGQSPSLLIQLRPEKENQGDVLVLRNLGLP